MSGANLAARMRTLVAQGGAWVMSGRVKVEEGESSHYRITEDGDVLVSVELDDGRPFWAVLMTAAASGAGGIFRIPTPGTRALVGILGGETEQGGMLLDTWPENMPDYIEQAATRMVLVDNEIWAYSGTGTPEPVALKSDLENHRSWAATHAHGYVDTIPGAPPTPTPKLTTVPTLVPTGTPPDNPPPVAGSTVLKVQ